MHPSPTEPTTLRQWLQGRYPNAKVQALKRMVAAGRVQIGGRPATRLNQPVSPADSIRVNQRSHREPAGIAPLRIIHEDEDILVVHKPAGLLTSTTPRERRRTALQLVREYVERSRPRARVGLIHRLDRDAAGLLVFSLSHRAYQSLKTQFFQHSVTREYQAVVHGRPAPLRGRIESRLVERADGTVHSTLQPGRGQRAVTEYQVMAQQSDRAVLRVRLHTGRKHQIRVHLSEHGWPIVGDRVYGSSGGETSGLMLEAVLLALDHPADGRRVTYRVGGAGRGEPGQ
jgi:23S rRNA pseudouridine1911/1915/1917 synthase